MKRRLDRQFGSAFFFYGKMQQKECEKEGVFEGFPVNLMEDMVEINSTVFLRVQTGKSRESGLY